MKNILIAAKAVKKTMNRLKEAEVRDLIEFCDR